ncbi:hypothetical protein Bca4012_077315 [Brassica carinata]|uniref:Uncharacterized protein n=1 Tax=Brassica carinata TaxID=52824 RepID=A0A8X7Q7X7_BRACI|nr:hypothetical protein Bca52824_072403 [Brassica carinata]
MTNPEDLRRAIEVRPRRTDCSTDSTAAEPNDETPRTKEKDAPPPSHSVGTTIDRNRRKKEHIQDGGALHCNHAPQITEFRRKSKKGKTTPDETLPKEPTPTSRRRTPASQSFAVNQNKLVPILSKFETAN